MAKIESAMRTALEFNKALNRHDVQGMMEQLSEDCIFELPAPAPDNSEITGKEEIAHYWEDFFIRFPDVLFKIEEIFGLGKRCIIRWRAEWKDETGGKAQARGVDILKVEANRICEIFSYTKGETR
jgi:ketosteroid isomerase-like protein